jgi:glycerol-3-phosphate acyltransferase PlsY
VFAVPFVQLVVDGPYRTAMTGVLMTFIGLRFALAARPTPDPS